MPNPTLSDQRQFKAWNDEMVQKYDLDLFHQHPSPLVRWIEGTRVRRLMALLDAGPGDRVLEVGCGAGHLLARVRGPRTFGLDLSALLLARTVTRTGRAGAVVQGDAQQLPVRSGSCDRVYCSEVLEHLADPAAAVREIARILAPTGVAVVSVPNEHLINGLKAMVRRLGLSRLVLRTHDGDYAMPERMDDEWHLHSFDLRELLALVPTTLRVTRVVGIPFRWLPLRYVIRCEAVRHEPGGAGVRPATPARPVG